MATVIRAGEPATRIAKRLEALDLADHVGRANAVAQRAREEAAVTLERARREAEHLVAASRNSGYDAGHGEGLKVGYDKGFSEGQAAGLQSARGEAMAAFAQEQRNVADDLRRMIADLDALREDWRISAARSALEFAVKLATKLTFAVGVSHREAVLANLERAMSRLGEKSRLIVVMNPADREALERFAAEIAADLDKSAALKLKVDDSIAPGGCRVRTESAEVDATLETQIEEIVGLLVGEEKPHA